MGKGKQRPPQFNRQSKGYQQNMYKNQCSRHCLGCCRDSSGIPGRLEGFPDCCSSGIRVSGRLYAVYEQLHEEIPGCVQEDGCSEGNVFEAAPSKRNRRKADSENVHHVGQGERGLVPETELKSKVQVKLHFFL